MLQRSPSVSSDSLSPRRATSWQPVTPPQTECAEEVIVDTRFVLRPASECAPRRDVDVDSSDESRRVKMYSKRDRAKLIKEYEHARDPALVEVAPEQRCTRCMRNQWRCYIEADPQSPRRVCRPCGKNKCSFGNAKARPEVVPFQEEKVRVEHALAPSHMPYASMPPSVLPSMPYPSMRWHPYRGSEYQRKEHHSAPQPPLSPSAHIYRRGSRAPSTHPSPRTPPLLHAGWRPSPDCVRPKPPSRDQVLGTLHDLMAHARDMMLRLKEVEEVILRREV